MHRFFISSSDILTDEHAFIRSPDLHSQWTRVLRFQKGESVILLDNTGFEYEAVISEMSLKEILCEILQKRRCPASTEPSFRLIAAQSLLKNSEKFEWVLQKGTELGISRFIPLITDRTEQRFLRRRERLEKILRESAEQSGRGRIPVLDEPMRFEEVLEKYFDVFIAHPAADLKFSELKFSDFKKQFLEKAQKNFFSEISFCVGPEGGFSDREIEYARKKNAHIFSLGKRILRSETAPLVLATLIGEWAGEF